MGAQRRRYAGAFWWSYFTRGKLELDHALEAVQGRARSMLARDAFSIIHFPMLLGVIAFAAAVEHALSHAAEPLGVAVRALLAASVLLFAGGLALALLRAGAPVPLARWVVPPLAAAMVFGLATVPAVVSLALVLAGMVVLAVGESGVLALQRHHC